jgi:hypothetical protein
MERSTVSTTVEANVGRVNDTEEAVDPELWKAHNVVSRAEALWESKSQIAGLACQDIRYKDPVCQTARLHQITNNHSPKFQSSRGHSLVRHIIPQRQNLFSSGPAVQ